MSQNPRLQACLRWLFRLCLLNLAFIAVVIAGRMLLQWPGYKMFMLYVFGAQLGLALSGVGIVVFGYALFKNRALMRPCLLIFLHGVLPTIVAVLAVGPGAFKSPLIHDIATDTDNPPEFATAHTLRRADENSLEYAGADLAAMQKAAYPDLRPLFSASDADAAFDRSLAVVEKLGWTISEENRGAGRIEAYEVSLIFGFVDDVAIRITEMEHGIRIDLRSASRVGLGDLGMNADRIRGFIMEYNSL